MLSIHILFSFLRSHFKSFQWEVIRESRRSPSSEDLDPEVGKQRGQELLG